MDPSPGLIKSQKHRLRTGENDSGRHPNNAHVRNYLRALKSEKGFKVVLRGVEDVKVDLESQGYHSVRVNCMRKSQKNPDMVVVVVPRGESKIYSVSRVAALL